ncbi:hypothetical protein D3C87_1778100 [compost metagenome]
MAVYRDKIYPPDLERGCGIRSGRTDQGCCRIIICACPGVLPSAERATAGFSQP